MSGTFSTYLESALLGHVFAGVNYVAPAAVFAALFTATPTPDGGGTEVAGGSYMRMAVAFSAPSGSPPTTSNPNAIQWAMATADWGVCTAAGLYDAPTLGNFLGAAPLVSAVDGVTPGPINIPAGSIFRLPPQGMVLGFVIPPQTPVPFTAEALVRARRPMMRPVVGEVLDGSGVGRMGLVMVRS